MICRAIRLSLGAPMQTVVQQAVDAFVYLETAIAVVLGFIGCKLIGSFVRPPPSRTSSSRSSRWPHMVVIVLLACASAGGLRVVDEHVTPIGAGRPRIGDRVEHPRHYGGYRRRRRDDSRVNGTLSPRIVFALAKLSTHFSSSQYQR